MRNLHIRSASEQLADYLKEEIQNRKWTETMPGESWLVTQLQVGRETVRAAMMQLEAEGILAPAGQGKRRRIVLSPNAFANRKIRVRIFIYDKHARREIDASSLLADLLEMGFDAEFTGKNLKDLNMQVERVARYAKKNPADAWILYAASREVIEWFAEQGVPALAMYGQHTGISIAAAYTRLIPTIMMAVRRLVELGHKRIVMLTRGERRKPNLSLTAQTFLEELEAAGIKTSDYNLPDWEESRQGLGQLVDKLLRFSPPTAIIFVEPQLYIAARTYLADRGIVAPRDISLVVADDDPSFEWCDPVPSHIRVDYESVARLAVQWVKRVALGKVDQRKRFTETKFIEGGTIGPARTGKLFR